MTMRQTLMASLMIAAGLIPILALGVLAAESSARASKSAVTVAESKSNAPTDWKGGPTCKERREKAQKDFNSECIPAFTGMTVSTSCQDMCIGNGEFSTQSDCDKQCGFCMFYLRTIEKNKNCE